MLVWKKKSLKKTIFREKIGRTIPTSHRRVTYQDHFKRMVSNDRTTVENYVIESP